MKKMTTILLTAAIFLTIGIVIPKPAEGIETEELKIYNASDLTAEILENRNGKIIIEKAYGVVIDDEGNGRELLDNNDFNGDYEGIEDNYYISYHRVEGAKKGDIICSYFIYDPNNNGVDTIIERFDYIVEEGIEK